MIKDATNIEDSFQSELERLRFALDNVSAYVYMKDRESRYTYANKQVLNMYGCTSKEVLGRDDSIFFPPEAVKQLRDADLKVLHGEISEREIDFVDYNNIRHTFLDIKTPIYDSAEKKKITGLLGIASDITSRKLLENEINNKNKELLATVEELTRTRQVAETLAQAAEAANLAKSTFLANMSHELRTPLNAILGFSSILERDRWIVGENKKKLATINRAGQHLLELINDVLEISRIEAGRVTIQRESFALKDLIVSAEEMIFARAEAKGLAFQVESGPDLPLIVEGDASHLKQVLINLLGNAVKYTKQGHVHLRVSRRNEEICFEISDTGSGISEEDQKKLFQAFYQTDSAIAQGEGTGLGLAISMEYTRLMNGHLEVSSQLGKGSVFTLTIPLPETGVPVIKRSTGRVTRLAEDQNEVRVLLVDDKEDNRALVKELLESAGFAVRVAENGLQAVEIFQSWRPRMILMDIRMPVMDGYEATRQIRKLPEGDTVKIVALTASAFEEERKNILASGCDDMVRKPIEEDKLFAVMGELLGLRYHYAEAVLSEAGKMDDLDLSVLELNVVRELNAAAEILDVEKVMQLLAQFSRAHPSLAAELDALAQSYRFDRIMDLCRAAELHK